jgi:hypothetical protein
MARKARFDVSHEGKTFDEERELEIEIYQKVFLSLMSKKELVAEPEDLKDLAIKSTEALAALLDEIEDDSDSDEEAWSTFVECYLDCIGPVIAQLKMNDIHNEKTMCHTVAEYAVAMFSGIVEGFFEDDEEERGMN